MVGMDMAVVIPLQLCDVIAICEPYYSWHFISIQKPNIPTNYAVIIGIYLSKLNFVRPSLCLSGQLLNGREEILMLTIQGGIKYW